MFCSIKAEIMLYAVGDYSKYYVCLGIELIKTNTLKERQEFEASTKLNDAYFQLKRPLSE